MLLQDSKNAGRHVFAKIRRRERHGSEGEERREREREEGSAPELEPGALGGPGGERAANRALITVITVINEMLAANGDGVGRNARR